MDEPSKNQPQLLDLAQVTIRTKHYNLRTEETYLGRVKHLLYWTASGIGGRWAKNLVSLCFLLFL